MKKKHLDRIQSFLDRGKRPTGWNVQVQFDAQSDTNDNYTENYLFNSFLIDLKSKYAKVSLGKTENYTNCSSFVQYIFNERVVCPAYVWVSPISHPTYCQSKAFKKPELWLKKYVEKYLQRDEPIGKDLLTKLSWEEGWGRYILQTCTLGQCSRNDRWGGKRNTRKLKRKQRATRRH